MASINIQNNEYDYNKFYSQSQKDNSLIDIEDNNKRSANESFGFGSGSIANIKDRLFSQEDLFHEDDLQHPDSIVQYQGHSSDSGMSINAINNALGRIPSSGNSHVSPKSLIDSLRLPVTIPQHAGRNDFVLSPSERRGNLEERSHTQQKDIKVSGSLNIKDLGSGSYSDANDFGTYSSDRFEPQRGDRFQTSQGHPGAFESTSSQTNTTKRDNIVTFSDITIGGMSKHLRQQNPTTPDRLEFSRKDQILNHFFKTSPSSSEKHEPVRDHFRLSGLEETDDRLMASDGLQEIEYKISFQRDPDSSSNTGQKSTNRRSERDSLSSDKKSKKQRDTLPKVNTGGINSETLLRLEQKYFRNQQAPNDSNSALQNFRKDSVGRKLRDALVNLKTQGSIAHPFKKKSQLIYLKASRGSSRNSQNNSGMVKNASSKNIGVKPQQNAVMVALNTMILKSRKGSFGQTSSRESSAGSKKSGTNSSRPTRLRIDQVESSNRGLKLLHKTEVSDKNSRSASHRALRRRNLLDINAQSRDQSHAKSEMRQTESGGKKSALQIASSKISSNSTKRLFERIFSKEKLPDHSSEIRRHRVQADHDAGDKVSEGSFRPVEGSVKNSRTESKKNLELDNLIKKMYQASNSKVVTEERSTKKGNTQFSQDHKSVSSLFASKRSLFLDTLAHKPFPDRADTGRRSREKIPSSRQETSIAAELSLKEPSKLSLMSSKTNPEKGIGFLNPEQNREKKNGLASKNKQVQPKGREQWVEEPRNHSARDGDKQLLPVVEQEDILIHRKTLYISGQSKGEITKSGTLREGREFANLPRCPTEGGYSSKSILDKYSHLLKADTSSKNRVELSPNDRGVKYSRPKKALNLNVDPRNEAKSLKKPQKVQRFTKVEQQVKPRLLNDFIQSFDARYKDSD